MKYYYDINTKLVYRYNGTNAEYLSLKDQMRYPLNNAIIDFFNENIVSKDAQRHGWVDSATFAGTLFGIGIGNKRLIDITDEVLFMMI